MPSRPRSALLVDEHTEVTDLSNRGLIDCNSLSRCVRLSSVSLHNNSLESISGLQRCARLWSLDLRECGLTSVQPLIYLGAMSELHLGQNRLSLAAVLKLHSMVIGRLGLQGNPLLPDATRASLNVTAGIDDSRLLRSFLADELPCVVAIDDSFVTSAERHHCRMYFDAHPQGQAMRNELLPIDAATDVDITRPPVTCADLRARGRGFERAETLVHMFSDAELLHNADGDVRAQADTRRLRWLSADHDISQHVTFVAASKAAAAAANAPTGATIQTEIQPETGDEGGHQLSPQRRPSLTLEILPPKLPPPPLSLAALVGRKWLSAARRLELMALLAYSLHHAVAGALVHEALYAILAPEVKAAHIAALARLPACLRAALLLLLARRGHDGVSSQPLWRFLSWAAIFTDPYVTPTRLQAQRAAGLSPPHRAPAALHTAGFRARHRARRRARVAVHPPDTGVIAHGLRSGTLRQSSLPLSRSCDRLATVYKKSKISRYLCCPHFRSFNSLPTVSTENTVASKSAHDGRCNPDKYSSTPSTACSPRSLLPGVSLKSAAARP